VNYVSILNHVNMPAWCEHFKPCEHVCDALSERIKPCENVCDALCERSDCFLLLQCSVSCGVGIQSRRLVCTSKELDTIGNVVHSELCNHIPTPTEPLHKECEETSCPKWVTGTWSQVCEISHIYNVGYDCSLHGHVAIPFIRPPKPEACWRGRN